ncbi:hypothetical protein ACWERV_32445 [Streptomyces sp. NPDC004031]
MQLIPSLKTWNIAGQLAREAFIKGFTAVSDIESSQITALPLTASDSLRLRRHTAGRIGSLARLIRQAAITALTDGTERITKTTLEAIRLDHLAEQDYRPRTRTRSASAL